MTKKGKKRWKSGDNLRKETKSDPECSSKTNKSDPECSPKTNKCDDVHVGGRPDGIGPSEECREPWLEPKHRIFLSHSGAQKDFTWQLCVDLERVQHYPFFDRRDDSLPKGEKFPPLIIEAARRCRIAVLVISDEFFTRSKWPMIELNEFVKAQGSGNRDLKILPLFLGITMEQFHEEERQVGWFMKWEEFARADGRIDVGAWKVALSKIPGGINAMQYGGCVEGEVVFRGKVVEVVCKLLCPDLKYDVSHVQSLEQLCKPIKKKLEAANISSRFKVKVVGLYGMGGVGKTTISTAICNEMFGDFGGKVCHVEFGGKDKEELQRRVLRELTHANASILECDAKKLDYLLKQRMSEHEVFLVLDNVWDDQVEEALKYLKGGHHSRSMVLVTSRSMKVLKRLGVEECSCMEMSSLEEEGAMDVLLHYSGISRKSIVDESELEIVRRCANMCRFSRGEKSTSWRSDEVRTYHPLALRTLGCQLVNKEIKDWDEALKGLDKFNILKERIHPVFSVLRLGYDALHNDLKEIFLDLALLWSFNWPSSPMYWFRIEGNGNMLEWEWLCTLHSISEDDMVASVEAIQRKGLLEKVHDITKLEFNIHDLYYDFAEAEARAEPFEKRRILLEKGGCDILEELEEDPPNGSHWICLRRLIICKSAVKSLNLHHCRNVEVLVLKDCVKLEVVDVTGMNKLRVLVAIECCFHGTIFRGLETLKNLVYFSMLGYDLGHNVQAMYAFDSTKLRVVKLKSSRWSPHGVVFPLALSKCTNLKEVDLVYQGCWHRPMKGLTHVDLGKDLPTSVQKLHVLVYNNLGSSPICAMAAFTNLQDLNLGGCKGIRYLTGLCELNALHRLDVSDTSIFEIPSRGWKLRHLHYLNVSGCKYLMSMVGITHASALRTFLAHDCISLWEVPDDVSSLQHLEVLDLRGSSKICRLPEDFEKLVGYPGSDGKLKVRVEGCWGLIVPLVRKLRGSENLHDACEDGCNHGSSESMSSWVAAKKRIDVAAYSLLHCICCSYENTVPGYVLRYNWTYLLVDDNLIQDVWIRALCEHDICGNRTDRLVGVIEEVTLNVVADGVGAQWWVLVATAPCTFKVATEGALMEPWVKTILHYTLMYILPKFLHWRGKMIYERKMDNWKDEVAEQGDESRSWFLETWAYRAMVDVLEKCREKLDDASEQGIDHVRCDEGKKVVNAFLLELEAAKSEEVHHESILRIDKWYIPGRRRYGYNELYPNFQFGSTLATQECGEGN